MLCAYTRVSGLSVDVPIDVDIFVVGLTSVLGFFAIYILINTCVVL